MATIALIAVRRPKHQQHPPMLIESKGVKGMLKPRATATPLYLAHPSIPSRTRLRTPPPWQPCVGKPECSSHRHGLVHPVCPKTPHAFIYEDHIGLDPQKITHVHYGVCIIQKNHSSFSLLLFTSDSISVSTSKRNMKEYKGICRTAPWFAATIKCPCHADWVKGYENPKN